LQWSLPPPSLRVELPLMSRGRTWLPPARTRSRAFVPFVQFGPGAPRNPRRAIGEGSGAPNPSSFPFIPVRAASAFQPGTQEHGEALDRNLAMCWRHLMATTATAGSGSFVGRSGRRRCCLLRHLMCNARSRCTVRRAPEAPRRRNRLAGVALAFSSHGGADRRGDVIGQLFVVAPDRHRPDRPVGRAKKRPHPGLTPGTWCGSKPTSRAGT
jgi:hypothetical protein